MLISWLISLKGSTQYRRALFLAKDLYPPGRAVLLSPKVKCLFPPLQYLCPTLEPPTDLTSLLNPSPIYNHSRLFAGARILSSLNIDDTEISDCSTLP